MKRMMRIRTRGVKCLALLLVVFAAFVTLLASYSPYTPTHPYKQQQQQRGDNEIRDKQIRRTDPRVKSPSETGLEDAWILNGKLEDDNAGKTRLRTPGNVKEVNIEEPGSRNEKLEDENSEKSDIIQDEKLNDEERGLELIEKLNKITNEEPGNPNEKLENRNSEKTDIIQYEKLQNEELLLKINEKLNNTNNEKLGSPNEELEGENSEKADIIQDEELVNNIELDKDLHGKVNDAENEKSGSPNEELEVNDDEKTDIIQDEKVDRKESGKSNVFIDENKKIENGNENTKTENENENKNTIQIENEIENFETGKMNENENVNRRENKINKTETKNLHRNENHRIENKLKSHNETQIPVYFDSLENFTPKDFIEVQKLNPKTVTDSKKAVGKKKKVHNRVTNVRGYSPKELRERAQTFPENSTMRAFLREQERRVKHINSTCQSLQPSLAEIVAGSRGPPLGLMSVVHIIYDRINQLTFCPVYKAASTSWTYMLLQLAGLWTRDMKKQPLQKLCKTFYPKLSGPSIPVVTKDTTHFLMVRHPLERLLSCYRDKFQNASKDYYYRLYGEKMVKRFRKSLSTLHIEQVLKYQQEVRVAMRLGGPVHLPDNPFANPLGPTFPEFVQHVAYTKQDDEHWRPYTTMCSPCLLPYEFVLRFESLQEEREHFLEYINRVDDAKLRWDNHNVGGDTKTLACDFYSQLSLNQIDLLIEKYQKDLVLFEYDPEMYRKCAWDYVEVG